MAAAPEQSRRRWGRYEEICEIASGGMATVHLAKNLDTQRLAAVKSLHPHLMADDDVVQNFIDENHIVSRICHPNVVPVLEVAQNDAGYYQAMEYVDGAPLGKLLVFCIRGGSWLSIEACARVAIDTLEGLDAAHQLKNNAGELTGVVHRDVGPANILVDVFGMARVIDFGVATMAVRYTAPGSDNIKGRLAYMAPEQAKTPKDVDRRADLFSVGVVLWELLAARRLFKGKSENETLQNLLGQEIPSLGLIREDVEPELEALVAKALDRDPEQRFQTAREFIDALNEAVDVESVDTRKELGQLVVDAFGEELAERRQSALQAAEADAQVPAWTELSSIAPPAGGGSSAPPGAQLGSPPPPRKNRWPWLLAALLFGGLGFTLWRTQAVNAPVQAKEPSVSLVMASATPAAEVEPAPEVPKPTAAPAEPEPKAEAETPEPEATTAPKAPVVAPGYRWTPPKAKPPPSDVDLTNPYR